MAPREALPALGERSRTLRRKKSTTIAVGLIVELGRRAPRKSTRQAQYGPAGGAVLEKFICCALLRARRARPELYTARSIAHVDSRTRRGLLQVGWGSCMHGRTGQLRLLTGSPLLPPPHRRVQTVGQPS